MRICHVSTEVAGFRGGGIGTYVVEAARALTAAGHEVWLVTRDPGRREREALAAHAAFHRVLFVEDFERDPEAHRFALARGAFRFSHLAHAALADAGVQFDWIEFPDYEAGGYVPVLERTLFDAYADAAVAVHLHSPTWECYRYNLQLHNLTPTQRELCVLEDDAIRRAPLKLCPSQRLRDMTAERLGFGADTVDIVRYPMELPPEPPSTTRPRESLAGLRCLYFGRLEARKGVQNLVEAFRELPEMELELVGADRPSSPLGTSHRAWLERRATKNVRFSPALSRNALLRRLHDVDVCILPSLWENWPNTCIESMAAGRVVLGARNGGMSEMIVPGESGFLVDGSDPDDIVRVVRAELRPALGRLDEIGRAAAVRIRELSDPATYVARIEELAARARARTRPAPARASGRVTVVLPYHDEDERLLGEAIDSAVGQTHRDLEILVVDDGSQRPDAGDVLQRAAARDPRIRVLHKINGGLASARNHAIDHASGDFLLFLDADNRLRPEYAVTALEVFDRCPDVMAVVPMVQKFEERTGQPRGVFNPIPFERSLAFLRNENGDAGAIVRTSALLDHDLRFDPMVDAYSDWALWLDFARLGLRVQPVARVLYEYRVRSDSMTGRSGFDRHLALLGLLVERHWVPGDEEADRQMMLTHVQGWGVGALLAALGERPEFFERPTDVARRLRNGSTRYRLADFMVNTLDKVPVLGAAARAAVLQGLRLHGRWKDARRGRRG